MLLMPRPKFTCKVSGTERVGVKATLAFALPPSRRFDTTLLGYDSFLECVPELVITKPSAHRQAAVRELSCALPASLVTVRMSAGG